MYYSEKNKAISIRVNKDCYEKIQKFIKANTGYSAKLGWSFSFSSLVCQAMEDFCKKYKID